MGRSRYQEGTVKLVGKKVKAWRGSWHSYTIDADGVEHRHHHTRTLGLKAEMTKDEAHKSFGKSLTVRLHRVLAPAPTRT